MKKFILAAILVLGMSANAFAGGITETQDRNTPFQITATVYNDSGSSLTSGTVVIWDNDDTEFDNTLAPYVTTTASADSDWVAGVTLDPTCDSGELCTIVVYGPAWTRVADSTDAVAEDTGVATTTVAGMAGDYGPAANTCMLGVLMDSYNKESGGDENIDGQVFPVFVNPTCQ